MICRYKLYHFTVANTRFTALLTRREKKNHFSTIKWYNLCLQIIQSQKCYPLNIIICKEHHSALLGVWYMTAHICAGGLKKKLDIRSGSQRQRHFVGFFNVSVQAPTLATLFTRLFRETAPFSRLLRHAGDTEGHFLDLTPPLPGVLTGEQMMKWHVRHLSVCLSVCPVSWPWKCFK